MSVREKSPSIKSRRIDLEERHGLFAPIEKEAHIREPGSNRASRFPRSGIIGDLLGLFSSWNRLILFLWCCIVSSGGR
jgi:hypothetical protein